MSESAKNYIPAELSMKDHGRAVRVWAVATAFVFAWLIFIMFAPVLALIGNADAGSAFFRFFGAICHQLPERSFFLAGEQFAVCSRCFGVYAGLAFGFATYPLLRRVDDIEPLPRFWLFASLIPLSIDWSLTFFGIWENTHFTRFVTGALLGVACAVYVVPAVVEIAQNLSRPARDRPA
jgi:uncharacterized membrane protein